MELYDILWTASTILCIIIWMRSAASLNSIERNLCRHCISTVRCSQKNIDKFDLLTPVLTIFETSSISSYTQNEFIWTKTLCWTNTNINTYTSLLQQVHNNAECIRIFIIVQAAGLRDLSGMAGDIIGSPSIYPVLDFESLQWKYTITNVIWWYSDELLCDITVHEQIILPMITL